MVYDDKTPAEALILLLKDNGIDAYPPAIKKGECTKEYVVIKKSGASQIGVYSSQVVYFDIMCYVPQNKYTSLERFKNHVRDIIHNGLYPRLMETGSETTDYFDDEVKGHMVSFMLRNNVRNRYI